MSPDWRYRYSRKGPDSICWAALRVTCHDSLKTEMPKKSWKMPKHQMLILEVIFQTAVSSFSHVILHTGQSPLLLTLLKFAPRLF